MQRAACRVQYSQSEMKCSIAYMADVTLKNVSKLSASVPFYWLTGGQLLEAQSRGTFMKRCT